MSHTGKKDSNPTGQKSQSEPKKSKGTRHTTVGNVYEGGAADIHPISGKDGRVAANFGSPMSGDAVHSGIPIQTTGLKVASGDAEAPFDGGAALDEGLTNSIGTSASGVHKDLPATSKHPAAQEGVKNPKGHAYHEHTGAAALEEAKNKESFRQAYKK